MIGKYDARGFDVGIYEAVDDLLCQQNNWENPNAKIILKCGKKASTTLIFSYAGSPILVTHLCEGCFKGLAHKFTQASSDV